jgi:hypothetical protein
MKRFFIWLTIISFVNSDAQIIPSSCSAHDSVISKYRTDADRIAVSNATYTNYGDSVAIDPALRTRFLNALIAVYNATSLATRDTVVSLIKIHTFYNPPLKQFSIQADSNMQWMKNARQNIFPTGNASLDYLMSKYYLKKESYYVPFSSLTHFLGLSADTNCNISALVNLAANTVPGITSAYPNWSVGDGNHIFGACSPNFTDLIYSYGTGDCPAGCIYRRNWRFRVYSDCSVEFVDNPKTWPLPVGFDEIQNSPSQTKIYPVPVQNNLNINHSHADHIIVYNITGNIIYESKALENPTVISTAAWSAGIYVVAIKYGDGTKIYKVIKD